MGASLAGLSEDAREAAMRRWELLRPHVEDRVTLTVIAERSGVPVRTLSRWLARYRTDGLVGLARQRRSDRGARRTRPEMVTLIEGLVLTRPRLALQTVHDRVIAVAAERGWETPSYATVRSVAAALDPALVTLAHSGPAAYRDRYDLVIRHEAGRPNDRWQADHTELDLLVVDDRGRPARPWLTVIEDDHSRAIAGYALNLSAPSALHTALALRHAIWRKDDPAWHLCGIPQVLYVDHGSDFTSRHLEQVAADSHISLIHSTVAVPRGRGKIERLFSTVNQRFLPGLVGHLVAGRPATPPALILAELDALFLRFVVDDYNTTPHSETGHAPQARWEAGGFLPRMPESLQALDLLLLTVARPRTVQRDGIKFQGLRYVDVNLAAYVGEEVTIRYDPRDVTAIRVFHHDQFLCTANCPELAGQTIALKDLVAARRARRKELAGTVKDRRSVVDQLIAAHQPPPQPPVLPAPPSAAAAGPTLKRYRDD